MTRIGIPGPLVCSIAATVIACSHPGGRSKEAPSRAPTVVTSPAALFEVADDAWTGIVPVGAFSDVAAFCAAQEELASAEVPSCEEDDDALARTRVDLGGEILGAKAISLGLGTDRLTFLLVRTAAGYIAVREALSGSAIDDASAIAELRGSSAALEIVTTSARSSDHDGEEATTVSTRSRSCRFDGGSVDCSAPEAIGVSVVVRDPGES